MGSIHMCLPAPGDQEHRDGPEPGGVKRPANSGQLSFSRSWELATGTPKTLTNENTAVQWLTQFYQSDVPSDWLVPVPFRLFNTLKVTPAHRHGRS